MGNVPVTLKGINGNVVLKIDPNAPFSDVISYMEGLVLNQRNFFSKGHLYIDTQGRVLSSDEVSLIEKIFSDIGVSFRINNEEKVYGAVRNDNQNVLIIDHTVRSGQLISFDGDVVILGNINPGAEVEVTKDLYVFGAIKGTVRVGRRVVALAFQPTKLQVNGKIVDFQNVNDRSRKPRMIEVINDTISFKTLDEREPKSVRRGKNG